MDNKNHKKQKESESKLQKDNEKFQTLLSEALSKDKKTHANVGVIGRGRSIPTLTDLFHGVDWSSFKDETGVTKVLIMDTIAKPATITLHEIKHSVLSRFKKIVPDCDVSVVSHEGNSLEIYLELPVIKEIFLDRETRLSSIGGVVRVRYSKMNQKIYKQVKAYGGPKENRFMLDKSSTAYIKLNDKRLLRKLMKLHNTVFDFEVKDGLVILKG